LKRIAFAGQLDEELRNRPFFGNRREHRAAQRVCCMPDFLQTVIKLIS
jgi:hypothetical protein